METCKNAFGALRVEEKEKRQNDKATVLPRSLVVAKETKSASAQAKTSWADVNDDDDDYFYDEDVSHLQNRNKPNYARSTEESSSAEEVEDSDDEEDPTSSEIQDHIAQEKKASQIAQAAKAVSERERREKEVRDLNAALAELGMAVGGGGSSVSDLPRSSPPISLAKKKVKKDIKIDDVERHVTLDSNEVVNVVSGASNVTKSPLSEKAKDTPIVDRDEVLKKLRLQNGKVKKSPGKQKTSTVADLPSVRAEAKKKAEGKKLKVKKSAKLPSYQT